MNRLELGKYWLTRLCQAMPDASVRMVTRMAWHLAALSVRDDDGLAKLPDAALGQFNGGSRHFLELRAAYLKRRSVSVVPLEEPRIFVSFAGSAVSGV